MDETILEVKLDKPILPRSKVVFDMEFQAQVPPRSGAVAGIIPPAKCGFP